MRNLTKNNKTTNQNPSCSTGRRGRRFLSICLSLALLLSLLAGCGAANGDPAADASATGDDATGNIDAFPVTIVDMLGREVSIEAAPEKVVALSSGECELVYALGGGDLLVGRGEYCDFPSDALDIPSVQSGYEINVEQILALQPDLIVTSDMDTAPEVIEQLEKAGIPVLESTETDINGVYTSIENMGKALGKSEAAASIITDMHSTFEKVQEKALGHDAKTVYFEVSPLEWGLWTAGKGTFMDEIATMCGLENCFADVDGWAEISEEQVLERNPDIIVTISMYYGEGPTPVEEILGRPGWENVSAVANNAILNLQNNELSRPANRLAEGASMLADFAWGE